MDIKKTIKQKVKIDKADVKTKEEFRSVIISVRTYPSFSKWLKENEVSPSELFNETIKQLKK